MSATLLEERDRLRECLQASEARHRALFENSSEAIFLIKDGRLIDCNPAACRLFGSTRGEVLGQSPWRFSPEVQPDGVRSAIKADEFMSAALAGRPQAFEWLYETVDGTQFYGEVSLTRLQLKDAVLLQAMVRDVTSQREFAAKLADTNRQLEQALSFRARFLAMMSHELRTPLNAIIGLTGILAMKLAGPLTRGQEKHLQGVRSSALHLLSIINDMLDLTRLESGRFELHPERVSPLEVLQEVTAAMRPMASEKGLEFALATDGMPQPILIDRRMLKQILFNLVSNGVKYTDSGSISVTLRSDATAVYFRIADTGPGIAEEHRDLLFREFVRLPTHPTKEGTGLGLYLSQKLAGLIGGRITFENAAGGGSVFTLALTMPEVLA